MSKHSPPLSNQTRFVKSAIWLTTQYSMSAIAYLRRHPYSSAILSVGLALLLMLALEPLAMMTQTPFLLFFGAVVVSAWQGGIRSGLVATGLSALISNYFFLEPKYSLVLAPSNGVRLAVFVLECILISILCGSLRTTNQRLDRHFSQLKASEESLQTANQGITDILESITDGFYTLDTQWRFAYINTQAEQILKRSRDELLGQSIWEKLPGVRGTLFEQSFHRAVSERVPVLFESCGIVNPERWFEVHVNPLHDGLAVYFQDVTERKQAEEALRLSENRYRTLANAVPQMMWVNGSDGRVQFLNQQWVDYTGIPLELNLKVWIQVIHPDDAPSVLAVRTRAIEASEAYEMELRLKRFDGIYRWHLARIVPLKDEAGRVVNWFGTATDIHDVKQVEEALRESEERFRLSTRAVDGVVYDWDVQEDTVYRSEGLYHLIGIHPENVPKRKNWWGERIHPDDLARIESVMAPIFQGSSDRYEFEYRVRHEQGHWLDVWDRGYLIRDQEGQVVRIVGSTADITRRKQIEETLKRSEERLRFAIEGAELGTWDYDIASGEILWSDHCKRIFGSPPDANVDYQVFLNVLHPEDRECIHAAVERAIAHHEDYDVEMRSLWTDGTVHWVRSIGRAYYSQDGTPMRMAGVALDITNRKQAEQERERLLERERSAREEAEVANRIKDEFLAVLSHELRSPLNPILGWSKLLRTGKLDATKTAHALETIERNAKLQTQLIEDLLDVSRILRGKLSLNMAPVNLAVKIEAALETVRLAAQAKSIQFQIRLDPTTRPVLGDSTRLQQVVWNLLSNAVKFTPEGGQVDIRVEYSASQAQITVSDTGIGIAPDFLPHVFEYFRQADSTTTRKFGGLGLGLAIVRHLVELHGGTVQADSPGEGQGATFTVSLPLMPLPTQTSQSKPPATPGVHLTGLRILVVDDEPDIRDIVSFIVEQAGAVVSVAACAPEALKLMKQPLPDVLICDIGMPDMDGYMLMRFLRTLPPSQGGKIPAIALTAYAGETNQQQALAAGFQQHIAKPVQPNDLVRAIAALVNR
ncbi:MAG TPA: PAS domain S-box protein [Waterburya sp.]|jgi:PAS domain S-box-containing protein